MSNDQEDESKEDVPVPSQAPKIVICGGPASGKGTQCEFIKKEWNVVHLSSGDMLRAAIETGSEEGLKAKEFMNDGKLVPDQLIIDIVAKRVQEQDCQERGYVLDGFPRTAVQVEAMLAAGVKCDVFLQIEVSDEAIVERVSGRRMDPETGKIYHLKYLPPPEDVVHRLQQRDDDTEEKIKVRLATYHKNLDGIVPHFEHCKVVVNGNDKKPEQLWLELRRNMRKRPYLDFFFPNSETDVDMEGRRIPRIVICGGPASGKGTQCEFIKKEWNVVHLSSGDMLRAAIETGSEEGLKAKEFMNEGKLVPDQLIIDIVAKRVQEQDCQERGYVLDGFPRTAVQVEAMLAAGVKCDVFLQIEVSDEAIVERVSGRRMDPETGKIYHLKYLPPPEDVVHRLQQRDDDTEEKIKVRLATYHKNLDGIVPHFEHCKVVVNGNDKKPEQIWRELRHKMSRFLKFHVVFVIGAPSSGKSVLCHELAKACSAYNCISVSNLLTAERHTGSPEATAITKAMDAGKEVPLRIIVDMISREMFRSFDSPLPCTKFIIDGFPNSCTTFDTWYEMMGHCSSVDFFIYLDAPHDILQPRLQQKMTEDSATKCIADYHHVAAPMIASMDRCGKLRALDALMNPKVLVKEATKLLCGVELMNPLERTFAIVKPDAVANGKAHEIHRAILDDGRLVVLASKFVEFDGKATEELYGRNFKTSHLKNQLKTFMCSGPSLCMILEGPDAVRVWRDMIGPVDSRVAVAEAPKSLRALYGSDECRNACHGSDNEGSAMREINFLLSPTSSGHRLGALNNSNPVEGDSCITDVLGVKSLGGLALQDTCAVLKPLTADLYYDEIISIIQSQGFEIVSEVKTRIKEDCVKTFYAEHKERNFFDRLVSYMCSRRVVSLHLRRPGAIQVWRNLMGCSDLTQSRVAQPDSLRALYAVDTLKNAVGGSDSQGSATRELNHYFSLGSALPSPTNIPDPLLGSPQNALPPIVTPASKDQTSSHHSSHSYHPSQDRSHRAKRQSTPYELGPVSHGDMTAINTYNKSEIHPVLAPVISKLMMYRPKDVKKFVLTELETWTNDSNIEES